MASVAAAVTIRDLKVYFIIKTLVLVLDKEPLRIAGGLAA